jgi:subtilase family serine protease
MRLQLSTSYLISTQFAIKNPSTFRRHPRLRVLLFMAVVAAACTSLLAQTANRVTQAVDSAQVQALPHHLPSWASSANQSGLTSADLKLEQMTLVLARSSAQEAALQQLLADQQNPASPSYHHWLTPEEMGERFGLSDPDIATITGWLQSQGLHVNWVAPNRTFIGFGGTAAQVNQAFQAELHTYTVNGEKRYSISSDPMIPTALAPAIKSVRGLSTPGEKPQLHAKTLQSASPKMTVTESGTTYHFIAPADFATIYDVPTSYTGAGYTIGIVGWSRVDLADLDNFRSLTGTTFPDPTEVVPTAYGGIDPGAAYTTTQSNSVDVSGQEEATLDVLRAGSTAPGASLLLVASSSSGTDDGIGADAQYLVNTVPAQIMSISFGDCESSEGKNNVDYWDSLFQTAAAEGISVFVSSGDSGAAGCDTSFSAPPSTATANSPNYICSSSYATCVGGTEFSNDTSTYWESSNTSTLGSAVSYIPEGGWNEASATNVAGSGGGVSSYITTPTWQKGVTGVPTAYAGRYTPDVSFSTSGQNGYFACVAADGASCSGSNYYFEVFEGTSAAAPAMAGVAALLDQKLASSQGNLNPSIYATATAYPAAFHDVTVSSSGVGSCSVNTVSLCDNSIYKSASSVQAGYAVGTGYDEVTGLGSLDVLNFLDDYTTPSTTAAPTVTTGSATSITSTTATLNGAVIPNGVDTTVWFLYGTSSTLSGASQTTSQDLGSGTTATAVTASLSGLTSGTTYYFELVAKNSLGTVDGAIKSFTATSTTTTAIFTITGTAVTISTPGATSGNTSTITVTPSGGFTGSVALTASITSSPSGAAYLPTLSFGSTTPVSITSTSAKTATLTITTTATSSASLAKPMRPSIPWYAEGGAALACILLFGIPARRRRWRNMLGMMVLLVALAGGMLACGGSGGSGSTSTSVAGTTKGTYTITVTGTSGSTVETGTVTLTVN